MSIITVLPGIKRSGVSFLLFTLFLWNWPSYFPPYWVCVDLGTMSYCFQAPWQWCWCFRPPILRFVVIFFSPHRLTNPNPGNLFDAKRKERGWPKPYGFLLGFLTTLLPRISVYLSFALFCSFFVGEINWNWNWRFSSAHKKMKNTMIYWPQGQWGGENKSSSTL